MQNIKNIIFDLGGVILNIDIKLTELALQELGIDQFSDPITRSSVGSLFKEYETGKIADAGFIKAIQALTVRPATQEEIIHAWNALLLDFPPERIELLQKLKKKYRLFLLSNTNSIHHRQFQQQLYLQTGSYLEDLFEKTYYSHAINLRKPDLASFKVVINENELDPAETLFVDDSEVNIAAAKELGLSVVHITTGKSILDIGW